MSSIVTVNNEVNYVNAISTLVLSFAQANYLFKISFRRTLNQPITLSPFTESGKLF